MAAPSMPLKTPTRILALDLGSMTGWARRTPDESPTLAYGVWVFPGTREERLAALHDQLWNHVSWPYDGHVATR